MVHPLGHRLLLIVRVLIAVYIVGMVISISVGPWLLELLLVCVANLPSQLMFLPEISLQVQRRYQGMLLIHPLLGSLRGVFSYNVRFDVSDLHSLREFILIDVLSLLVSRFV